MLAEEQEKRLLVAFQDGNVDIVERYVSDYLKNNGDISYLSVLKYLSVTKHVASAVEIIFGLANRGFCSVIFAELVIDFAKGVEWDVCEDVKLAALLVLPKCVNFDESIRLTLLQALESQNVVVRDAALVGAQAYFGIPAEDVRHGYGDEDMINHIDPAVLEWLGFRGVNKNLH